MRQKTIQITVDSMGENMVLLFSVWICADKLEMLHFHTLSVCTMKHKDPLAFCQADVIRLLDLVEVIFLLNYMNKSFKILCFRLGFHRKCCPGFFFLFVMGAQRTQSVWKRQKYISVIKIFCCPADDLIV